MAYCTQCSNPIRSGADFCSNCGTKVRTGKTKHPAKKKPKPHLKPKKILSSSTQGRTLSKIVPTKRVNRRALIIKAATKGLAKSLTMSAAVLGPGLLLLAQEQLVFGMLWLFAGSFGLMARTYHRPWRLMWMTCLLPPVAAVISYMIQLALFGNLMPPGWLLFTAVVGGGLVGYGRARVHTVYEKDGTIFAQRTIGYLIIWIVAYAATQFLGLLSKNVVLVQGGLITGAFSTVMLSIVSIVLLYKCAAKKIAIRPTGNISILVIISFSLLFSDISDGYATTYTHGKRHPSWSESDVEHFIDAIDKAMKLGGKTLQQNNWKGTWHSGSRSFSATGSARLEYRTRARFSHPRHTNGTDDILDIYFWKYHSANQAKEGVEGIIRGFKNIHTQSTGIQNFRFLSDRDMGLGNNSHMITIDVSDPRGETKYRDQVKYLLSSGAWIIYLGRMPEEETARAALTALYNGFYQAGEFSPQGGLGEGGGGSETGGVTSGTVDQPVTRPPDPPDDIIFPNPEETAAAAAAIAAILIAAGIAIHIANSIAAALAQAIQAGVEFTTDEINEAIAQGLEKAQSPPDTEHEKPPPKPKGPTLYDKEGQTFERNDQGEYWAPDEKGEWVWMDEAHARESAAALEREKGLRDAEIREHDRETERMLDESRKKTRARHQHERDEENANRTQSERGRKRREKLLAGIEKSLDGMEDGARRSALMDWYSQVLHEGNTEGANDLWREVRGDRQAKLDQWHRDAQFHEGTARIAGGFESGAALVRDGSKQVLAAGVAVATGGTASIGGAAVAGMGTAGLSGIGALEKGLESSRDGQGLKWDNHKAAGGAVRGLKTAMSSMVGGVPANGNALVALAKVGSQAVMDGAETYGDVYQQSGDGDKALEKAAKAMGLSMAQNAMGELWDEKTRGFKSEMDELGTDFPDLANFGNEQAARQQMLNNAKKSATNILGNTAQGVMVKEQDLGTALGGAVYGEATGLFAGKLVSGADPLAAETLPGKQPGLTDTVEGSAKNRADEAPSVKSPEETAPDNTTGSRGDLPEKQTPSQESMVKSGNNNLDDGPKIAEDGGVANRTVKTPATENPHEPASDNAVDTKNTPAERPEQPESPLVKDDGDASDRGRKITKEGGSESLADEPSSIESPGKKDPENAVDTQGTKPEGQTQPEESLDKNDEGDLGGGTETTSVKDEHGPLYKELVALKRRQQELEGYREELGKMLREEDPVMRGLNERITETEQKIETTLKSHPAGEEADLAANSRNRLERLKKERDWAVPDRGCCSVSLYCHKGCATKR
jgi:hypothetical protein